MKNTLMRPLPPKLHEIMDLGWLFPVDFPVVNDSITPDATRTLKAVIQYGLQQYYYDHRIFTHDVQEFNRHLQNRLYNKMVQHQYWIDEYLNLIADKQFFYNDEWQDMSNQTNQTDDATTAATDNRTANNLSRTSDTPQNNVADINNYLTTATKDEGTDNTVSNQTDNNTMARTRTEDNHIKKSTLGDITVQFRNFAEFPNFMDVLIKAVAPCFLLTYSQDYDCDMDCDC